MTQGQCEQVGVFDAGVLAVPGLDALRDIHTGRSPQPPIQSWSGRRLVALQRGEASIAMPASGWFCGPKGRLHSGIFAFLLDMAHLYAVVSTLPAGGGCTTAELSVTVLGEPPASGAEITACSRVIYSDERNALAEGACGRPERAAAGPQYLPVLSVCTRHRRPAAPGPRSAAGDAPSGKRDHAGGTRAADRPGRPSAAPGAERT
jgi:acyl-coenzyme A thioesterase PaaI-like protein